MSGSRLSGLLATMMQRSPERAPVYIEIQRHSSGTKPQHNPSQVGFFQYRGAYCEKHCFCTINGANNEGTHHLFFMRCAHWCVKYSSVCISFPKSTRHVCLYHGLRRLPIWSLAVDFLNVRYDKASIKMQRSGLIGNTAGEQTWSRTNSGAAGLFIALKQRIIKSTER